jgi:VanZ family protein
LRHARTWRLLARLGLVATLLVSLAPLPDLGVRVEHGDKYEHLVWYFALTLWYAQLVAPRRALAWRALGLFALGAAIEALQGLTAWRSADWRDLVANAAGIAIGLALGLTPARDWLARLEARRRA